MNQHQQRPITQAELARLKGVTRSAVSRAVKGPLAAAAVADRVDRAHPAVRRWLNEVDVDFEQLLTFDEFSARTGIPVEELERDRHLFKEAIVEPVDLEHPAVVDFLATKTAARRAKARTK